MLLTQQFTNFINAALSGIYLVTHEADEGQRCRPRLTAAVFFLAREKFGADPGPREGALYRGTPPHSSA